MSDGKDEPSDEMLADWIDNAPEKYDEWLVSIGLEPMWVEWHSLRKEYDEWKKQQRYEYIASLHRSKSTEALHSSLSVNKSNNLDLLDGMMKRIGPLSATDVAFVALKRMRSVVRDLMDPETDSSDRWKSYELTLTTHADFSDLHRTRATRRAIDFLIRRLRKMIFVQVKLDFLQHVSNHIHVPLMG